MNPNPYEQLTEAMSSGGVDAVFDRLIETFKQEKEYHRLFDALTMRARYELGIPLIQLSASSEFAADLRAPYEDKVIAACREVGGLLLEEGDILNAFRYFNMIGEVEPIRDAVERFEPTDSDETADGVIEVAVSYGVNPRRGLELVLERYGTCQAITTCEQLLHQESTADAREECIKTLVRALHAELVDRLASEIAGQENSAPATSSVSLLIKDRDWLFENENYHIDTSHLNAVVRMARMLPKCEELYLAIQCCEYGQKLSERYRYPEPPPFENVYQDSTIYFNAVVGKDAAAAIAHFKQKADKAAVSDEGNYPAEVYVNLLVLLGKMDDAIDYAARKLNTSSGQTGISVNELCQRAGRFDKLAQLARRREDLLSYTAGLIQQQQTETTAVS